MPLFCFLDSPESRIFVCEPEADRGMPKSNTVSELGSVTKVFTALIACELERKGVWNLSDAVKLHLPDNVQAPIFEGAEIRIENLMRQDNGLPWNPHETERTESGKIDLVTMK